MGDAHEQPRLRSERSHAGPKRALCVQFGTGAGGDRITIAVTATAIARITAMDEAITAMEQAVTATEQAPRATLKLK